MAANLLDYIGRGKKGAESKRVREETEKIEQK